MLERLNNVFNTVAIHDSNQPQKHLCPTPKHVGCNRPSKELIQAQFKKVNATEVKSVQISEATVEVAIQHLIDATPPSLSLADACPVRPWIQTAQHMYNQHANTQTPVNKCTQS